MTTEPIRTAKQLQTLFEALPRAEQSKFLRGIISSNDPIIAAFAKNKRNEGQESIDLYNEFMEQLDGSMEIWDRLENGRNSRRNHNICRLRDELTPPRSWGQVAKKLKDLNPEWTLSGPACERRYKERKTAIDKVKTVFLLGGHPELRPWSVEFVEYFFSEKGIEDVWSITNPKRDS